MSNISKEVTISSKITSFEDTAKGLKELEKKVNELFHITNTKNPDDDKNIRDGATRLSKLNNEEYRLEFKTNDGWKSLYLKDDEVKLGETKVQNDREKVIDISDLETLDVNANDDITKKTIVNPNTGRYDINHLVNYPRADFISPWFVLSSDNDSFVLEKNKPYTQDGVTTTKHPDIYHSLGTKELFPYLLGRWLDTTGTYQMAPLVVGCNSSWWPASDQSGGPYMSGTGGDDATKFRRLGVNVFFWNENACEVAMNEDGIMAFDNTFKSGTTNTKWPAENWLHNYNYSNNSDGDNYIFYEMECKLFLWKLNSKEFYNPDAIIDTGGSGTDNA